MENCRAEDDDSGRVVITAGIYLRQLASQVQAVVQYQADFWILVVSSALMNLVGFCLVWAIFRQTSEIAGWSFWQVVVIYSSIFVAEGFTSLFFEGAWELPRLVNRGDLDFILVRPMNPVLQTLGCAVGLNGLGNVLLGSFLFGDALIHLQLDFTWRRVAWLFVMLASAVTIKLAINLASNASAFWVKSPFTTFAFSIHEVGDLARYPLTIYTEPIKFTLTFILPFAFISFFPTTVLLGKEDWFAVGLLTPAVAAATLIASIGVFRLGLGRYESVGN